jgi:hypothetical protein
MRSIMAIASTATGKGNCVEFARKEALDEDILEVG